MLHLSQPSYQALKRILKHCTAQEASIAPPPSPHCSSTVSTSARSASTMRFWDEYCQIATHGSHEPDPSTTTNP